MDKNTKTDLVIIERKTVSDLYASIKDGRYEEQSYRLNGIEHHNHNTVYLIEGNIHNTTPLVKYKWDKTTIYSSMVSILFYKGFSVLRSQDVTESAYIICNMCYKIHKTVNRSFYYQNIIPEHVINHTGTTDIYKNDNIETTIINYSNVVKRVKKDNVTKENIGQIMLCQIPGVSSQTACAIIAKCKNMNNLIKMIENDQTCLNDIFTVDSNNKQRKISKTCIQNIIQFLQP